MKRTEVQWEEMRQQAERIEHGRRQGKLTGARSRRAKQLG